MRLQLLAAIVATMMALVFYSVAIWGMFIKKKLRLWHIVLFWLGLAGDITGSLLMVALAGHFEINLHGISGIAAVLLMLVNALWATSVYSTQDTAHMNAYRRFGLLVWCLWLVPFISGLIIGMAR